LGATTLTVTGICSVCDRLPNVAVIVTDPVVADDDAFAVSVLVTAEVEVIETGLVPREHVSPVVPEHDRLTLPVSPWTGVTVIVSVVLPPVVTVSVLLPAASWKSGSAIVTLMTTEFVTLPLVPVRVTVPVCWF